MIFNSISQDFQFRYYFFVQIYISISKLFQLLYRVHNDDNNEQPSPHNYIRAFVSLVYSNKKIENSRTETLKSIRCHYHRIREDGVMDVWIIRKYFCYFWFVTCKYHIKLNCKPCTCKPGFF